MKKARLMYVFAVLLSVAFILTLNHSITITVFCIVLILPILSFILLVLNNIFIKFDVGADKQVYEKNEPIHAKIVISNESIFICPMIKVFVKQINENGRSVNEILFTMTLLPFQKIVLDKNIAISRRGLYEIGVVEIEIFDLFGIFNYKKELNLVDDFFVLPKQIILADRLESKSLTEIGEEKSNKIGDDRTSVAYTKEYEEGDLLKSVHWNLSSRVEDNLIVKVFQHPNESNILIAADMQSYIEEDEELAEDNGDAVVETALSLALRCLYDEKACTMYWYDSKLGKFVWYEINTFADYEEAFNHLAATNISYDGITIDHVLDNLEEIDIHNKVFYFIVQNISVKTAEIVTSLAQLEDNDVNLICFDYLNTEQTSDYIEQLMLNNVNSVRYTDQSVPFSLGAFQKGI